MAALREDDVLEMLKGVAETLRSVVSAQTEIVVHDMRRPDASIVAIVNGHVSGRSPNQSILAGPIDDRGFDDLVSPAGTETKIASVVGSYATRTRDGRELRSSTTIVRDRDGQPFAAFCVNVDLAAARTLQRQVQALLLPPVACDVAEEAEPDGTIDSLIEEIIETAITAHGTPVRQMSKAQKVQAVRAMNSRGLFLIRGSVERVARSLSTTKFTIYNYLEELGVSRS